jgi:hypothetical protein
MEQELELVNDKIKKLGIGKAQHICGEIELSTRKR